NRRAATWWALREALDPETGAGIALPPDPALVADLAMPRWRLANRAGAGAIQIEAKDEIRKRLGRSPDRGDAVVMAWAFGGGRPGGADDRFIRYPTHANLGNSRYARAKCRAQPDYKPQQCFGDPPVLTQAEIV